MISSEDVAFFITGMGRSGSLWLSDLLQSANSDSVCVMHEPLGPRDQEWYGKVYRNPVLGPEWLWFRHRMMNTQRTRGKRWGEVNSYLRYVAHDLRVAYPDTPVVGLVRDGRFVVRSLMRIGIYAKRNPPVPPPTWADTSFLKCAWYWGDTYRLLIAWGIPIFRLEDLNDKYAEVQLLCQTLGMDAPPLAEWEARCRKPINTTEESIDRLDWTREQCEDFRRAAGDVQTQLGYPLFMMTTPFDAPPKQIEGTMGIE